MIRIDYENVQVRVQEISDVIQILNAQKCTLVQTSMNLHNAWQGDAALTFKVKLDELIGELDNLIKEMATIKNDILTVAKNIKFADEEIANKIS